MAVLLLLAFKPFGVGRQRPLRSSEPALRTRPWPLRHRQMAKGTSDMCRIAPNSGQSTPARAAEVPFAFFVGCERSGTTLLRAMFDSHSELAVPGESYFIVEMLKRRARYELRDGLDLQKFVDDLASHRWFVRWSFPLEILREELFEAKPRDLPDAFRLVFRLEAARQGKVRYGDKTPRYVLDLPLLAAAFPEARFVHLIGTAVTSPSLSWPGPIGDPTPWVRQRSSIGEPSAVDDVPDATSATATRRSGMRISSTGPSLSPSRFAGSLIFSTRKE